MQDKQKVTLYLSQDLHRRLKVRSALDLEPMSDLAERAIDFYLAYPDVVENRLAQGQTHRVYSCPECTSSVVLRSDALVSLKEQSNLNVSQDELVVTNSKVCVGSGSLGEEQLVPC
jgi:hypothetical protein